MCGGHAGSPAGPLRAGVALLCLLTCAEDRAVSGSRLLHSLLVQKCRGASHAHHRRVLPSPPLPPPPPPLHLRGLIGACWRSLLSDSASCLPLPLATREEEQGSEGFQGGCSLAWRGHPWTVPSFCRGARRLASCPGRAQPRFSLGLFLAPRPRLKPGYKCPSPPYSLAI